MSGDYAMDYEPPRETVLKNGKNIIIHFKAVVSSSLEVLTVQILELVLHTSHEFILYNS